MFREPPGERIRAPVWQNVYQRVTFEIHQNGSVATPTAESEIVHAQDPRCFVILELQRADMVQQSVPADNDPEVFQKTRARLTPEGEKDVREPAVEPLAPVSVVGGDAGQAFREDRSAAGLVVAKEPSDVQVNADGRALPGQVR